jgi:hypothetical protein
MPEPNIASLDYTTTKVAIRRPLSGLGKPEIKGVLRHGFTSESCSIKAREWVRGVGAQAPASHEAAAERRVCVV